MHAAASILPHDLLWGLPLAALPADASGWVHDVISQGHPVVVRRARVADGFVAVGVRGRTRDQRYAALMRLADITRRVAPEQLICSADESLQAWPALRALRALGQIRPLMDALDLPWGVAGSAGFELACGVPVLHQDSDLDLILRTEAFFSREQAAELVKALEAAVCRIDLQLQTPSGAVALREWAGQARHVLLKAHDTARLVSNPWQLQEQAA